MAKERLKLKNIVESTRLTPSQFGSGAWPDEQAKHSDILCLRPPERTGVPLSTLHDAFHRFRCVVKIPFQQSPQTIAAARAADRLVRLMGSSFEDEMDRTKVFNQCIEPVFASKQWQLQVSVDREAERCSGSIDAFHAGNSTVATILRQDKMELGHDGDPYMQVSRGYHMYVKTLEDRKDYEARAALARGAPMFLLCVHGTNATLFVIP